MSLEDGAGLVRTNRDNPTAFRETLGVEVVKAAHLLKLSAYPPQRAYYAEQDPDKHLYSPFQASEVQ